MTKSEPKVTLIPTSRRFKYDKPHPYGWKVCFRQTAITPNGTRRRVYACAVGINRSAAIANAMHGIISLQSKLSPEIQAYRKEEMEELRAQSRKKYEAASPEDQAVADKYETLTGRRRKTYRYRHRFALSRAGACELNPTNNVKGGAA